MKLTFKTNKIYTLELTNNIFNYLIVFINKINILNQNLINLPDSEFKNKFIEADFSNNFKKLINKAQNFRNDCHKYEYIIDKDEIIKIPVN